MVKPCWEEHPAARPDFRVICASIEELRRAAPTGEDYYTSGQGDEDHKGSDDGHADREEIYDDALG